MANEVFTLPAASKKLAISVRGLRELIRRGELRARKVGRAYLITEQELNRFLEPPSDPEPGEVGADFLTVSEYSEKAGIPPAKVRQWLRNGILKGAKGPRGRWTIDPKMIQWWTEIRTAINPKKWG